MVPWSQLCGPLIETVKETEDSGEQEIDYLLIDEKKICLFFFFFLQGPVPHIDLFTVLRLSG